jgi:hypothetical protein
LELLLLVLICFKIRHVKDELSIHWELLWIASFWILSSFLYFLAFNLFFCESDPQKPSWVNKFTIFLLIQFRNMSTMLISTIFCLKVTRSPNLVYTAEDVTSLATLLDFDLVMMSVVPYSYFKRYVGLYSKKRSKTQVDNSVYAEYLKLFTNLEIMNEMRQQLRKVEN